MLDQSYTPENLIKLISFDDFSKFSLGRNKNEIQSSMTNICQNINKRDFNFQLLGERVIGGNNIYVLKKAEDYFAIKKLNDNLKRLYKIKQANRHLIVKQISTLLSESIPMFIIKLDIKKFYENIDRKKILSKLQNDSLLTFQSKTILNKFFSIDQINRIQGLPRGINISATMSEIFMRDFDKRINQLTGVYYYARYVDDIIIFAFDRPKEILKIIEELLLKENNLKLNIKKTKLLKRVSCRCKPVCKCTGTCKCRDKCKCKDNIETEAFEYLGYKFTFSDTIYDYENLRITMADKKVNKIKTRIIDSIIDFTKTRDIDLLEKRISFLTGNYIVKSSQNFGTLKAGIYYNYPNINDYSVLENLTIFLRKIIAAKNKSFGRRIQRSPLRTNSAILAKYCFKSGFINRKEKKITLSEAINIKSCWSHD